MLLPVKVVPNSSRDAVVGWLGDSLKVKVAAAPEHGKANAAVCKLLAKTLGVSARQVSVVSGASTANKVLEISGVDEADARRLLPQ